MYRLNRSKRRLYVFNAAQDSYSALTNVYQAELEKAAQEEIPLGRQNSKQSLASEIIKQRQAAGDRKQKSYSLPYLFKRMGKINSRRWFFQAFGRVLDPNICVLIDAGTKPGGNSIYHLWKAFDLEPMCAGACGEIKAMLGTYQTERSA